MQHLYKFMLTDNSNILMAQQILAVKKEKHKHSKCFVSSCTLEITCSVALSFLKTLLGLVAERSAFTLWTVWFSARLFSHRMLLY